MAEVALRVPTFEDATAWCELFDDREVMRFIGDGAVRDQAYYAGLVDRQRTLAASTGLCLFSVLGNDRLVGFAGIQPWSHAWGPTGEWEIGWRLGRPFWGRGYASRAAHAALERARQAGVSHVVAMIQTGNAASFRVATRLGMVVERELLSPEQTVVHRLGLTLAS
ncbi:MAG: acetyltransferase [Blastococcus sp.]|jgi:RimJ/RimL family protein N-acetyltransferase|nr:acetyltransferase [Blastococcus sp.]